MSTLGPDDLRELEMRALGSVPTKEDADELASRISADPSDLPSRIRLYAFLVGSGCGPDALLGHVEHFCAHAPFLRMTNSRGIVTTRGERYESLRQSWEAAVHENAHPLALSNAISFFGDWDLGRAKEASTFAVQRYPDNAELQMRHGRVHLRGVDLGHQGFDAKVALTSLMRAHELSPQMPVLGFVATASWLAGITDRAEQFANLAISVTSSWLSHERHLGHTIRGCIVLPSSIAAAESDLEASVVDFPYEGPSLRLARELARMARVDSVRAFIRSVRQRWEGPSDRCDTWLRYLDTGEVDGLVNPGL